MAYIACLILAILVGFAYYPCLWTYFTADDFWHLPLLHQAFDLGKMELFWQNFSGPWAGRTSLYLFYRPVTELSLAFDYLLFGASPFYMHLSSMLWHYANCVLTYFVGAELLNLYLNDEERNKLVALLVACIFAVHPSQTEAVVWILARADLVGAFFYLFTVLFCLLYLKRPGKLFYCAMLGSLICGLGAKEMCATLPFVLWLLFYIAGKNNFKLVAPPLCVLFVYLIVRALALGSLVGGYVGTLGYMMNQSLLERLIVPQVWWKLAHPMNEQFVSDGGFYDSCLRYAYIVVAFLIVINVYFCSCIYKRFIFSTLAFSVVVLFILVNAQVWGVYESMAGSRIFYLLLFPLCLSIVNVIVPFKAETAKAKATRVMSYWILALSLLLVGTYTLLCNLNTQAWEKAGYQLQDMQAKLKKKIDSLPEHKKLAVVNLPAFINGTVAFFVSDFVPGFLEPPLTEKDYAQRLICLDTQREVVDMTNLKELAFDPEVELFLWDRQKNDLDPSLAPRLRQAKLHSGEVWEPLTIHSIGKFKSCELKIAKNKDFFKNQNSGNELESYMLDLPENAQIDADLILKLSKNETDTKDKKLIFLSFDDSSNRGSTEQMPIARRLSPGGEMEKLFVPISESKSWLAVQPQKQIRLDLPVGFSLGEARLINCNNMKPILALQGNIEQGTNGLYIVNKSLKNLEFKYSSSHIKNSCGVLVEVSKPYCSFFVYTGTLHDSQPSKHALKSLKLNAADGEFFLERSVFKEPGHYQIRIAPLSCEGKILFSFGDPVAIQIQ